MKKTIILIAGLFCLTAANVFAVENVSFRLKGMHGDFEGLVKDEYTDMMYMPYNILEIDGYRLYTNLSNLSTGNEEILDEIASSADEYLIGGVAPFGGFGKLGFIYGANSSLTPQTIRDENGNANLTTTSWQSGEYDFLWTSNASTASYREYGKAERETLKSDMSYLLGFQPVDVIKFGFLLNFSSDEDITTNAYSKKDDNWTLGTSSYSLTTSNVTDSEITKYITLGPAAELQVNDKLTIGGMLGIIFGEVEYADSSVQNWFRTQEYQGVGTADYSRIVSDSRTGKPEGTGFALKGIGKYSASDNLKLRGIFNYSTLSLDGSMGSPRSYNTIDDGWGNALKSEYAETGSMNIKTDFIELGAGFENKMNKDLMLTMGIKYSVDDESTKSVSDEIYKLNGSTVFNSYQPSYNNLDKSKITNLILPIGMEYKANKWMTLRMGASHKITTTESEDRTTTTSYAATYPVKTVSSIVTTVDPKSTTIVRDTDYSFGAGFKVTDNLQIDLLNFTNLTDMSFWKLSATLKFYGNSETSSGSRTKINTSDGSELKKKYWTKAVREYNKANYEKAISYWEKILDIDPGHKASLQKIEQAQKMMKNYE
ncbi:MAG: hypothetical protein Q7J59_03510 [Elusimicrobiota bacterium]|nr:hypothetical protein [Elusimicrobiota bacterium]